MRRVFIGIAAQRPDRGTPIQQNGIALDAAGKTNDAIADYEKSLSMNDETVR